MATCGSAVFSSPAKRYKVSRRRVLVDTFNREAIRRRIYQLYEAKEHVTVKKLLVTKLVTKLRVTVESGMFQKLLSPSDIVLMQVMEAGILMTRIIHLVVSNSMQLQAPSSNTRKQKPYFVSQHQKL